MGIIKYEARRRNANWQVFLKNVGFVPSRTLEITCDYTVTEETPQAESDTDPNTDQHPDEMAKHMIITLKQ